MIKTLTHIDFVLNRSEVYTGSGIEYQTREYVLNNNMFTKQQIMRNNLVLKLFDEVIMNSVDNIDWSITYNSRQSYIKIDTNDNYISIENDGYVIDLDKQNDIYKPQLLFCTLMTSTNYDDTVEWTGAGVYGLGVKLTNIFSTRFVIDIINNGTNYVQICEDNMKTINEPIFIKTDKPNRTKITYYIDKNWVKFDDLSLYKLIEKWVYEVASYINTFKKCDIFFN